ncbi:MAG: triose-phosphate isomerase [Planctomycetota bacterium]|jgi:triosephosphate isomerase
MRKPFICGNWKLNKNIAESVAFAEEFIPLVKDADSVEIGICAQFTALQSICSKLSGTNIGVGAQDCYWEEAGAFTGEIAPSMIKDTGCRYTIVGHSERRQYFGETNETVNKKTKAALNAGLDPIVCVGETLEERESGKMNDVVEDHVRGGLEGLTNDEMKKVTIAYEPVWAIGTGKTATPDQAQEVHLFIRKILADLFGSDIADGVRIQYGGSVKPENVKELMSKEDIDGALVGGASMKPDSFAAIVNF